MKRYQLKFDPDALKEWQKLDGSIKKEFLPQLLKRLDSPILESAEHVLLKIPTVDASAEVVGDLPDRLVALCSIGSCH